MIGSLNNNSNTQMIQLNQLDRQFNGQASQRSEQFRAKSAATIETLLGNAIENRQQAIRSSSQSLKGTSIDVYA